MDAGARKLLETSAIEILHAHYFSRASTQATNVLTDLLSRYLTVLSSTCAKYAEPAGRLGLTARDAACALNELGVGMEELSEYCATEGRDMSRYAAHTARRLEDLNEFRAALSVGLREDRDDAVYLEYMPVPDDLPSEEVSEEESEDESEEGVHMVSSPFTTVYAEKHVDEPEEEGAPISSKRKDEERISSPRPHTPPLPLSPISNPSTPPRKRPRTSSWNPPDHIPDFLPPFPSHSPRRTPSPPSISLPPATSSVPSLPAEIDRPITPPPEHASTTADYRTPVPHSISVLGSALLSHLPTRPLTPPSLPQPQHGVPDIQPSLYQAYHYALTHPPSKELGLINPTRYKVAVTLIEQAQLKNPRWEPIPSLYGISSPNAPRVNSNGPTYPIVLGQDDKIGNGKGKEPEEPKFPAPPARPVIGAERVAPLISQQGSRLPILSREVLTPTVLHRTSKLQPPPPLLQDGKKLTYGPGVNAPWNSGPALVQTPSLANGAKKEKDKDGKDAAPAKVMPDAKLYATWNWEQKSYRDPIRRARMGNVSLSGTMGNGRRKSESHA